MQSHLPVGMPDHIIKNYPTWMGIRSSMELKYKTSDAALSDEGIFFEAAIEPCFAHVPNLAFIFATIETRAAQYSN